MNSMIIDGRAIAARRIADLRLKIAELRFKPKLAVIIVGDDQASRTYVKMKKKRAEEVGIEIEIIEMGSETTDMDVRKKIEILNKDIYVRGIMVQLPLPHNLKDKTDEILQTIDPNKDVDGLTRKSKFLPATVKGILLLIEFTLGDSGRSADCRVAGMTASVLGQGRLVGESLSNELEKMGAKVHRIDEYTNPEKVNEFCLESDIIVCATGVSGLLKKEMVESDTIVIDCGSPDPEVDFENVSKIPGIKITPVPGGVGPMTIVSLLENTLTAALSS